LAVVATICRQGQGKAHIAPHSDLGDPQIELSVKQFA
jgi:hypothetical protein